MQDEKYIRRCLDLARNGLGYARPNPMVGCVIVHQDKIIGEGYHRANGGPHAEVNAVRSVKDHSLLKESTAYVSLEPCAHHGKTPPCADMLVKHQIKKVVICNRDPFHLVDGAGVEKLKAAGIEVVSGILDEEGRELNKRFFTYHEKKRPFVILKWAQSSDGFIAPEAQNAGEITWISNERSKQIAHQLRKENAAILVGKNTALKDNPSLTTRLIYGQNPTRVLLDSELECSKELKIFNDEALTIILNKHKDKEQGNIHYVQCDMSPQGILNALYTAKLQSVLIEGGAATLQSFIDAQLWDEAYVFQGPSALQSGILAPNLQHRQTINITSVGSDQLTIFKHA